MAHWAALSSSVISLRNSLHIYQKSIYRPEHLLNVRRMVSPALCGWRGRLRKVLDHVLLIVFVLLVHTVAPAMTQLLAPHVTPPSSSSVSTITTQTSRTTFPANSSVSTPPERNTGSPLSSTFTSSVTVTNRTSVTTPDPAVQQKSSAISANLENVTSPSPNPGSPSSLPPSTMATSPPPSTPHQLTTSDLGTTNRTTTPTSSMTDTDTTVTVSSASSHNTTDSGTTDQSNTTTSSATALNTTGLDTTNRTTTPTSSMTDTDTTVTVTTASSHNTTDSGTTDQSNTTTSSATALNTTEAAPIPCNFSQNCTDQSVYYWMMISVEVTGNVSDESNITAWLQNLFQQHLGECSSTPSAPSITPSQTPVTFTPSETSNSTQSNSLATTSANFSSAPSTQNVSSVTGLPFQNWTSGNSSIKENETTTSLFQSIEVICDNKTAIRLTECTVLLQLSQLTSPCCIARIVSIVQVNSTIQGQVVGNQVQRVAKGLCYSSYAEPAAGSFEKCNGSLSADAPCDSNATVNISCSGNSGYVYATLGIQDQMNCSSNYEMPKNYCYCSAYCNSSAAYYNLNFGISDLSLDTDQLKLQIPLTIRSPKCNITESGCKLWHDISNIYENSTVQCASKTSCSLIVKLKFAMDVCSVSSALITALQHLPGIETNGIVNRTAVCSWDNKPSLDSLQPDMRVSVNLNFSDFCMVPNLNNLLNYCEKGADLAVLLNESCTSAPVTVLPTSLPSSAATTTRITTNTTTTSLDNTTPLQITSTTLVNVTATKSTAALNTTAPDVPAVTTANATVSTPSAEVKAEELLQLSSNVSALSSAQLNQLVTQLEELLSGPNVSLALGKTSINIVSNLLDVPAKTLASTSSRIVGIVDSVGLKLVVQGQSETILSTSVALAVNKVNGVNFQQISFTLIDSSNVQISGGSKSRRSVEAKVLSPQGSIILPASLTGNLDPQQQQLASRVQFNFYQKSTLFQDSALNSNETRLISGVLGSSVANLSLSNLQDNVLITLSNTEAVSANSSVSCVFWDFGLNGGSGGWSSRGCTVLNSTVNETLCGCNHLTSFGVLLDLSRQGITNRLQDTILTYITYIGCGISAIFLSVTLLTYLSFEKLRKDMPSKILIQLCLALLLLNLVYLLDSWLALYPEAVGLCISTAFFLHYFLLASFTWMALEAVHMYFALVKVFNTYISRFMLKLALAGWGIPLVVVIIVIAIDKDNYGLVSYGKFEDGSTDDFCWLKSNIAFYVAVVAYFCVVFLLNVSMFIVVMVQLCRIKRQNPHNVQHRSGLQDLRSVAGLTVLLGLTWGFAFFAWGPVNLAFMYLFAIFNTLQGFFIFVFHCAVKENVRRQWRIYLCCGKFRLPENSDWSHTATQKTKKSSVNRVGLASVKSSNSNNSSSSTTFLVSNGSGSGSNRSLGISSPFDDREITAQETSSDVVLNEINNRYRSQRSY
ncbi:hypothetical protein MHYP_G00194890 [Metynnis hypsauchen]